MLKANPRDNHHPSILNGSQILVAVFVHGTGKGARGRRGCPDPNDGSLLFNFVRLSR